MERERRSDREASVATLAEGLRVRAQGLEQRRDPRCVFACAYHRLTRVLATALADSAATGFDDPDWVTALAHRFADYYLRALDQWDQGTLPPGAWSTVFAASQHRRTSVLEELLLGMTAHIVHDLPQALCDVGLWTAQGQSRIADYDRCNVLLARAIGAIQRELSHRYDPALGLLDLLAGGYDELLTSYGLRISRAVAWYNAERLLDPRTRQATLRAIANSPAITQRELLNPPLLSLQLVARWARVVSRLDRRWPTGPLGGD
jgi:hypothetical protein